MIAPSPRRGALRLLATAALAVLSPVPPFALRAATAAAPTPTGGPRAAESPPGASLASPLAETPPEPLPRARSWQRQTLLAATESEYLVLESEGHNPGRPDVWSETVRVVRFDAATNARGAAELIRVEVWTTDANGVRQIDTTRSAPIGLGQILDDFGGQLVPPPSVRLKRQFHADEGGVFVLDGGRRVEVLTREEIETRAAREPHPAGAPSLTVTALQQLGEQFWLTLRTGSGRRLRRELVMRIPR